MTAYLAGLAIIRCAEHEHADQLDVTARMVLVAMASFAAETDMPECYASQSAIAERAGLARSAVQSALGRLEGQGVIERAGKRWKTVRWRLLLCSREGHKVYAHEKGTSGPPAHEEGTRKSPRGGHKTGPRGGHKTGPRGGHKTPESTEDEGVTTERRAAPSPEASGAPPPAAHVQDKGVQPGRATTPKRIVCRRCPKTMTVGPTIVSTECPDCGAWLDVAEALRRQPITEGDL